MDGVHVEDVGVAADYVVAYGVHGEAGRQNQRDSRKMTDNLKFNAWSRERIIQGRKCCTSRHRKYLNDPLVYWISPMLPWWFIAGFLFESEGADNPMELQNVIEDILKREVPSEEGFYVHFFYNEKMQERLKG